MNTDASNVEDINIHQIIECLSLSFVASLRIVFASFALDHSPCARMIWIPATILILSHRLKQRIAALAVSKQRVSPFYRPSIHQISTLEKTKFYQHSILSNLLSVRIQRVGALLLSKQRVSPIYRTCHLADSEDFDFRVWFSPGFLIKR